MIAHLVTIRVDDEGGFDEESFYLSVAARSGSDIIYFDGDSEFGMTFEWTCVPGRSYQVMYSDTLAPESWREIGPVLTANAGQTILTDTDPTVVEPRFNKVIAFSFNPIAGRILYDTVSVDPRSPEVSESKVLESGQLYELEVSGTYTYGRGLPADAHWAYDDGAGTGEPPGWWEDYVWASPLIGNEGLELLIDGLPVDWLGSEDGVVWTPHTRSDDHRYRFCVYGKGKPLKLRIADTVYGDNGGGPLDISMFRIPVSQE